MSDESDVQALTELRDRLRAERGYDVPPEEPKAGARQRAADLPAALRAVVPDIDAEALERHAKLVEERQAAEERAAAERKAAREKARLADAIEAVRQTIPTTYRFDLRDPELRKRVQRADAIRETSSVLDRPNLVFRGQSGSGKSTLAGAAAIEWSSLRGGAAVMFTLAKDLDTASRYAKLGAEPELVVNARTTPLLVIDELGEPMRTAQWDDLRNVVFHRYQWALPTWVTTWLEPGDGEHGIARLYGDGFQRRILEHGRCALINCGG